MPDKLFYPFIACLTAAIVLTALFAGGPLNAGTANPIDPVKDGFVVEGDDLRRIVAAPGSTVGFSVDGEGRTAYATAAAHLSLAEAPPSAGVFVELGPEYESAFGGQELEVTVRARASASNPSEAMNLQYFTAAVGDSDPKSFTLSNQFEDYTIIYKPGKAKGEPGTDFVGIWPDLTGQGGMVDIERYSVQIKPAQDAPDLRGRSDAEQGG